MGWIGDQVKGVLLMAVLGGALLEIIYAVLRATPDGWWLWAGSLMLLVNIVLTQLALVLFFPLFFKFVPLGQEHAELADRLVRLAERADARVCGVFKSDMSRRTKAANAAVVGLGNTRRIILGDTLLQEFTPDEIETVLAHELGHRVHRDIPLGIAVESVVTLGGLWLALLGLMECGRLWLCRAGRCCGDCARCRSRRRLRQKRSKKCSTLRSTALWRG